MNLSCRLDDLIVPSEYCRYEFDKFDCSFAMLLRAMGRAVFAIYPFIEYEQMKFNRQAFIDAAL